MSLYDHLRLSGVFKDETSTGRHSDVSPYERALINMSEEEMQEMSQINETIKLVQHTDGSSS